MMYVGGKSKLAKELSGLIREYGGTRPFYVEPFIGGGAVFSATAPLFEIAVGADIVPDLALMWQAVIKGWEPPESVTEDEYAALRDAEPSALRGFVGFGCSFGGKWFGGYARHAGRNQAAESRRNVLAWVRSVDLVDAEILHADYQSLEHVVGALTTVYCDPPYANTQAYGAVGAFDTVQFWSVMESWAERGAAVLVSEYEAPSGWRVAWERSHRQALQGGAGKVTTERLWVRG